MISRIQKKLYTMQLPMTHQLMPSPLPSSGSAGPGSAFAPVYTLSMIPYDLEHPFGQFGSAALPVSPPTSCVPSASWGAVV